MANSNGGISWTDQWANDASNGGEVGIGKKENKSKKMQDVKAAASAGMAKAKVVASVGAEKAKVAATVGAQKAKIGALKVKSGTAFGIKWIKEQYSKRTKK